MCVLQEVPCEIVLECNVLALLDSVIDDDSGDKDRSEDRSDDTDNQCDYVAVADLLLGILMSVSVLSEIGVLNALGMWLSEKVSNSYIITGVIGILSSIVDNVPLVAGAMKMYPVADATAIAANPELMTMAQDGIFWQLLAYCAGVGGSMLIIGSAAGVVAMGTENISFGWYMKHISWIALVGYLAGMAVYFLEDLLILA